MLLPFKAEKIYQLRSSLHSVLIALMRETNRIYSRKLFLASWNVFSMHASRLFWIVIITGVTGCISSSLLYCMELYEVYLECSLVLSRTLYGVIVWSIFYKKIVLKWVFEVSVMDRGHKKALLCSSVLWGFSVCLVGAFFFFTAQCNWK